ARRASAAAGRPSTASLWGHPETPPRRRRRRSGQALGGQGGASEPSAGPAARAAGGPLVARTAGLKHPPSPMTDGPKRPAPFEGTIRESSSSRSDEACARPGNFIADIVDEDLRTGKNGGRLQTRFPPEPNGYLHVGHAKAICLNFGIAEKAPGGLCNLRMDDTNPLAEEAHFVEAIQEDVRWLGFDWGDRLFFACDYFERLYGCAVTLVKKGLAYVDSQTPEQIRENRGNYYKAGVDSPFRDRSVEENLALLEKMRRGELKEGEAVLRAK